MGEKVYKGNRAMILTVTFTSIVICVIAGNHLFYALSISVFFSSWMLIRDGFTFKERFIMTLI